MKQRKTISPTVAICINLIFVALLIFAGNMVYNGGMLTRAIKAVVIQCCIYSMLAVSLNVCTGYLGQLPLGHAGFMAIGAYTAALFWNATTAWPKALTLIAGLLLAGLVAAIFGILIGFPSLRLKGDYLAIITLGFGEIIRNVIINLPGITGGTPGLIGIPKYSSFLVTSICLVVTCYVIHTLLHSRHGRAVLAIRDNEIAADCTGINLTLYKVGTFAVSAFFAGLAGAVYAGYQGALFPSGFGFMQSINILTMVVLGGMGSMTGSIIAATVLTALPVIMQPLASYRMVIYSVLLIVVMIFKPSGLMGTKDFSMKRFLEGILNGDLFRKQKKGGEA